MATSDVVLFNALKHHLGYIKWYIRHSIAPHRALPSDLLTIGRSQMDLYTGDLEVGAIVNQISGWLNRTGYLQKERYFDFLATNEGFTIKKLSDGSLWVLRKGDQPQKFVHLHPARYSPHSLRIKATTLKTAIAVLVFYGKEARLQEINQVRVQILSLSPLKKLNGQTGIGAILRLIGSF